MICLWSIVSSKAQTTFGFTLNEACRTSAGVFSNYATTNWILIRTLWSSQFYLAGPHTATWDGLDMYSNTCTGGTLLFKVLCNNVKYSWDGAIGNTSSAPSGTNVHSGDNFINAMCASQSSNYYCSGYQEQRLPWRNFLTNTPQVCNQAWFWISNGVGNPPINNSPGVQLYEWSFTCADSNWVYFACPVTSNPNTQVLDYQGCIVASTAGQISNFVTFSSGVPIYDVQDGGIPNGIYVGTQSGLSGLAVQRNGPYLAAANTNDNKIYIYGKQTGALSNSFTVNGPGSISFGADSNLEVISFNAALGVNVLVSYTNVGTSPVMVLSNATFSNLLAVAADPFNQNRILLADGYGSQQVFQINEAGTVQLTLGIKGGMPTNGAKVLNNCFWFARQDESAQTFLCANYDGSFWVGDEENHRVMHFDTNMNYLEQIQYQPSSYKCSICQNNPSRVFNEFLEYAVNYTNVLSNSWTLTNNWKVNLSSTYIQYGDEGLYGVCTFPQNGRTYALVDNTGTPFNNPSELLELTNLFARDTGLAPLLDVPNIGAISLGADGSIYEVLNAPNYEWVQATLSGFSGNNPTWNASNILTTARASSTDPFPLLGDSYFSTAISGTGVMCSYNNNATNAGWHFGGIQLNSGNTNWLWQAGSAANGVSLNRHGNYSIVNSVNYAGDQVFAIDRNVLFGYHGENYAAAEAGQFLNYFDDGLMVGEFGESSIGHNGVIEFELPGFAGNGYASVFFKITNTLNQVSYYDYYLWVNDESAHGPQRWHFVNERNITEQSGLVVPNGSATLTNQTVNFPTGLTAYPGSASCALAWQAVSGAASYNVYSSLLNGGPYTNFCGSSSSASFTISSLPNGQTTFAVVTAVISGAEQIPSEQVEIFPFDQTQQVAGAGSTCEGDPYYNPMNLYSSVSATNYEGLQSVFHSGIGDFTTLDICYNGYGWLAEKTVGKSGWMDWFYFTNNGGGTVVSNLSSNFIVTTNAGLRYVQFTGREYSIDGTLYVSTNGNNYSLAAMPSGTVTIQSLDANFHYLTAVCPPYQGNGRYFTMTLTSTNGNSYAYTVNNPNGFTYMFQWIFKGTATLTVANISGQTLDPSATLQSIFLDDMPVAPQPNVVNIISSTSAPVTISSSPTAPLTITGK